jgi:protein-disulfide isomerase
MDQAPATAQARRKWLVLLDGASSLALLLAAVVVVWKMSSSGAVNVTSANGNTVEELDSIPIDLDGTRTMGSDKAAIAVLEFSDFECPYCGRHAREVLPEIRKTFVDTGKVQYVFKNFVLPSHQLAIPAAAAAECAGKQGRYWEMHDQLFVNQKALDRDHLVNYATDLGLQLRPFATCVDGPIKAEIAAHTKQGNDLGVQATPTFLIGLIKRNQVIASKKIKGAQPYKTFKDLFELLLKAET